MVISGWRISESPYGENNWFPLVDRNPQKFVTIYEAQKSDFQKAVTRIYYDAKAASNMVLPVLGIRIINL